MTTFLTVIGPLALFVAVVLFATYLAERVRQSGGDGLRQLLQHPMFWTSAALLWLPGILLGIGILAHKYLLSGGTQ